MFDVFPLIYCIFKYIVWLSRLGVDASGVPEQREQHGGQRLLHREGAGGGQDLPGGEVHHHRLPRVLLGRPSDRQQQHPTRWDRGQKYMYSTVRQWCGSALVVLRPHRPPYGSRSRRYPIMRIRIHIIEKKNPTDWLSSVGNYFFVWKKGKWCTVHCTVCKSNKRKKFPEI